MNKRPISITVVSWIFIVFGCIALVTALLPLLDKDASQRIADVKAHAPIWIIRMLAVLCGVFMLYGFNWARLSLVVWMGYHIILSFLHSAFEVFVHGLLFATVLYFLFSRQASFYFRGAQKKVKKT